MFVPFLRPFLGKQKGTTETKLKFINLDLMPNISEKVFQIMDCILKCPPSKGAMGDDQSPLPVFCWP